jgi:hypothetical protein
MKICVTCRKEMKCIKTGAVAVWHGHHCYAGDKYRCESCGCEIMVCNSNSYHSKEDLCQVEHALNMTGESHVD